MIEPETAQNRTRTHAPSAKQRTACLHWRGKRNTQTRANLVRLAATKDPFP
jgi:hypothetical protein